MFDWLFDGIAGLLSFFFDVTGSIGVAIILLTAAVMVLTAPLTMKGTRSMMRLQRFQPEMKRIQQQHKGDREKMNQELLAFYQEHNINPLGGCLPLLIQMPVFFVLFQVLRGLGHVTGEGVVAPKYLESTSELYQKIRDADGELISWGFDLADAATSGHASFVAALPYYVLIVLVGLTSWFSQKQAMGRRDPSMPLSPQQQMTQRIMLFFMPLISLSIPAGVVVYFVVSNLFRMGQQWLIHFLDSRDHATAPATGRGRSGAIAASSTEQAPSPAPANPAPGKGNPSSGGSGGARPTGGHPRSKKKKKRRKR